MCICVCVRVFITWSPSHQALSQHENLAEQIPKKVLPGSREHVVEREQDESEKKQYQDRERKKERVRARAYTHTRESMHARESVPESR